MDKGISKAVPVPCSERSPEFFLPRALREHKARVAPGETIFAAEQTPKEIILIEMGSVDLVIQQSRNGTRVLRRAGPNELIGVGAALSEFPYLNTAIALEETAIARISRDEFLDYLRQNPEEWIQVLRMLNHEASAAMMLAVGNRYSHKH